MTIFIDTGSQTPLYEQIAGQLRRQILDGTLPEGTVLPGIRALAAQVKVSIITTRRAYEELEREGLIITRQGQPSTVSIRDPAALREKEEAALEALLSRAALAAHTLGLSREEYLARAAARYDYNQKEDSR